MIKINLLPHKKVKPMEAGVLKMWIALGALSILLLAGSGVMWFVQMSELGELTENKTVLTDRLVKLQQEVSQVDTFEAARKVLEQKLVIIGELTKQRVPMTTLFNELNKHTTIDDIWFESLVFKDSSFIIECFGKTEKSVDSYYNAINKSGTFSNLGRTDINKVDNKLREGQVVYHTTISGQLAGYENVGKPLPKVGA
jgi:Tfp pilus assembly protein PilN